MSRIKGKDTRPEIKLRKYLFALGYRYRLHDKKLPGKPDLVLKKYNTVIFVHGCFWHRHEGCRYSTTPATRATFWQEKVDVEMTLWDREDYREAFREAGLRVAEQDCIADREVEIPPEEKFPTENWETREAMYDRYRRWGTLLTVGVAP